MSRPRYNRDAAGIGQVHLGVGAFMRAHVAVYTDNAMAAAGGNWGIAGVSLRRPDVRDQLVPQDCFYTVASLDNHSSSYRLIGAIRSMAVAPEDPLRVVQLLADAAVRVVTITVTEKGYGLAPDSGSLDTENPSIAHDLRSLDRPQSMLGFLAAAFERRRADGAPPMAVVSCDNQPDNGLRLKTALMEFVDRACPALSSWIDKSVAFPCTMVDRIVPATTEADRQAAAASNGVYDMALVKAEPFSQWVVEDRFIADRPAWDRAGALFVDRVEPYESAKLRLLNGPHSALAYLGYLGGYEYLHDVMAKPVYADYARQLMIREISPAAPEPEGMEHDTYIDTVLHRFANSALGHRTWQIAMDGSQKLPQRLLNTVRTQLDRGGPIAGLSLAVAAWMRYALGHDEHGATIDVQDPLAERFRAIAAGGATDPQRIVSDYLNIESVFGRDLADQPRFISAVTKQLKRLLDAGADSAVTCYLRTEDES